MSFRPAPRVARDEQFDESLFDRAARSRQPLEDESEGEEARAGREGLPPSYRMRHEPHYVEQIASKRHAEPVLLVPVGDIDGPHPIAPPHELQPLVQSIAKVGVLQPLLVRKNHGRYQLIAGARRLAAAITAGLTEVPCLVHVAGEERARALADAMAIGAHEPADSEEGRANTPIPAAVFTDITEHLGAIGACLHLFGDRDRPLRERVALGLVQAEVQRAAWLSQALAVLAGDPPLVANLVDLAPLVQRLLDTLTPERVLAGVEIDYEPAESRCLVRGDEQLLAIAVAGMVSGVHATVERVSGALLRVAVSAGPDEGTARVAVSQGIVSMPAAWRLRFFDMAWPDRPGGMSVGAGLAAARRVAQLHGGTLQLDALEPGGCIVTLTLPAQR